MSVYELKIVRIATRVGTEEGETTKMETRRLETAGERDGGWYGRWPRWRLHQSLSEKWKEERFSTIDRVSSSSSSSTTRYIRYIYTFTRTHIPLPALATLNLNLQTRIAPSPSSLTSLYVQRKAPLWKSMPRLLFVAQRGCLFFEKRKNYRFYIYFIKRNFYKAWIIFRTSLKGIHVAERS